MIEVFLSPITTPKKYPGNLEDYNLVEVIVRENKILEIMQAALLLLLAFIICGTGWQNKPASIFPPPADMIIDTIHSSILNEDRFIWIHIPEAAKNKTKKYPIIFLLDAEANFDATKNILDKLSKESSSKSASETILVGIGNIWLRYRDYSPSRVD